MKNKMLLLIGIIFSLLMIFPVYAEDCSGILRPDGMELLNGALSVIQYAGPILIVGLSIVELISAAASGNQEDLKKAFNRLIKRLIAGALLFFVVIIVNNVILPIFEIPASCIQG